MVRNKLLSKSQQSKLDQLPKMPTATEYITISLKHQFLACNKTEFFSLTPDAASILKKIFKKKNAVYKWG